MIIAFSPWMQRIGFVLWLVLIVPAVATAVWYVAGFFLPTTESWMLVLGAQAVAGVYLVWLFSRLGHNVANVAAREESIRSSRQQYEYLYQRSPVPYITIDRSGVITMANLAAVRLLEVTTETIIGQNFLGRIKPEEEDEYAIALGKLDSGVSITDFEVQLITAQEHARWVQLSVFVKGVRAKDRLVALIDITEQKGVDKAKSEFVALAAHQLRTPIAAIRWNAELMRGGSTFDEKQEKYFGKIESNILRMMNLINDFLSVSKLETGTFAAEFTTVQLDEYIEGVLEEHGSLIAKKNIQINTQFNPPDFVLSSDARLLHIVISNLVSNAAKYVRENGTITVSYNLSGNQLTYSVADTGIGIPQSEVEKLFTKFYRASNAETHHAEGTGLGLYIVQQSVELMGGTISVTSEENVGTTFTVVMPATQGRI